MKQLIVGRMELVEKPFSNRKQSLVVKAEPTFGRLIAGRHQTTLAAVASLCSKPSQLFGERKKKHLSFVDSMRANNKRP